MSNRKLKITWDGKHPCMFAVRDAETGDIIQGITSLTLHATTDRVHAVIDVDEFVLEIDADAKELDRKWRLGRDVAEVKASRDGSTPEVTG